ncbi:MAG: hypothetical protein A2252_07085 [Elusimicrobia bacterium RIFOXYA2_FULL_39_19]|nr:MAG: hypothetical protein A2252_07085 [Elusimicrobia bacterium RIFOXYA2_FULL_39_19]
MTHKVKIPLLAKETAVSDNTDLLTALSKAGVAIKAVCAGQGTCGSCKVKIISGEHFSSPSPWITKEEKENGICLACQTAVLGNMDIEVPKDSRLENIQTAGDEIPADTISEFPQTGANDFSKLSPLAVKIHIKLPEPSLKDNIPDFERLTKELTRITGIEQFSINLNLLKNISKFIRKSEWDITATIARHNCAQEIIQIEAGNTVSESYGIALDIGTTTLVAYLVNLNTGKVTASKGTINQQMSYGEDVITRIMYAQQKDGLQKLQNTIIENVNGLINALLIENSISPHNIMALQASGNTTMTHLFLGINPDYIRKEPYIPAINFPPSVYACEQGIKINPRGIISFMPSVASYVGGDITAGVLACGMDNSSEISLLIDLGTNGEIALGNNDWLVSAACSAGPAFEGVGIKCGIRAIDGAIQEIEISKDKLSVKYKTINDKKPRGICGTGLIDIPAELLRKGIINRDGRFVTADVSPRLRKNSDDEMEFLIAAATETENKRDIVITESDISNIIRSKGAIFLGIVVLLQEVGLGFDSISKIYISGGFGTYLDVEKAVTIGLLPDLPRNKYSFIGNSSITGAKLCLISQEARNKAAQLAGKMTYIELSVNPKFMNEYTSTLFLPHTDLNLFPTIKL